MECETQESYAGYIKHLNLHQPKTYICRYKINQLFIVLKVDSVSMNKSIAQEFVIAGSKIDVKYVNTVKSASQ